MQEDSHYDFQGYPSIHMSGYTTDLDLKQSHSSLYDHDEDHDTSAETFRWKFPIFEEAALTSVSKISSSHRDPYVYIYIYKSKAGIPARGPSFSPLDPRRLRTVCLIYLRMP